MSYVFDEYKMRDLPLRERLDKIKTILKEETDDESIRWDCIWLAGETFEETKKEMFPEYFESMRKEIADLFVNVLINDNNSIVRHEAAFQIGLHNMMDRLDDLIQAILHDRSELVKHEAIEAVGLLRAHKTTVTLNIMLADPSEAVRDTAKFVIKRLKRLENSGEYRGEAII